MAKTAAGQKPRIAIIGGYGGMGRFFASLFAVEGFPVTISGPNEISGRETARKIGAEYVKDNALAAKDADIVIISVPINATLDVIKEVAPHVMAGSLLMDLTSVKEKPCEYMEKHAPRDAEVLGTHPVFGHRVGGLEGQVFVLTPVRGKKWTSFIREFLGEHKARVYDSTPKEHDHVMAVVQGLTHFNYISVGKTLEKLDFDVKESRKYSSPIYDLMLDMIGRIVGQNPELYASIQMQNPQVSKVHRVFLETAGELADAVKKKDEARFIRIMKDAAGNFDDVERAMGRSDKAIHSLVSELEYLKNSVGKEICLRHIYSGTRHIGIVRSVTPDTVVLESGGKKSTLKISNLEVLNEADKALFKREFYGIVERDYSIVLSDEVDEAYLVSLLTRLDGNIVSAGIKDVYRGKQAGAGKKSVCFGFILVDSCVKATEENIKKFFDGIGGHSR
jgi:prephenate dehydrogenase